MASKQIKKLRRKIRHKDRTIKILLKKEDAKQEENIPWFGWIILTVIMFFTSCGIVSVIGFTSEIISNHKHQESSATITPSSSTDGKWEWSDSGDENYEIVEEKILAEGACVDKALSILSVIERDGKLDDSIHVAIGGNQLVGYHVQCVRIDPVTKEKHYLKLTSNFEVKYGYSEFDEWNLGDEYLYIDPYIFRSAAERFIPEMTYIEVRDFLHEYTQTKLKLETETVK